MRPDAGRVRPSLRPPGIPLRPLRLPEPPAAVVAAGAEPAPHNAALLRDDVPVGELPRLRPLRAEPHCPRLVVQFAFPLLRREDAPLRLRGAPELVVAAAHRTREAQSGRLLPWRPGAEEKGKEGGAQVAEARHKMCGSNKHNKTVKQKKTDTLADACGKTHAHSCASRATTSVVVPRTHSRGGWGTTRDARHAPPQRRRTRRGEQ
ncbi:uncharacterized protein Tco025E_02405 [Trypanosoma conorhini]|uniref:Uncharacterized protein n=1 Tax=Trypanosoma conorhini TaxID=83891 RepID=A0A3R7PTM5_9TRYP|nr:uncharacterized protein Tco025E_02405 [Trypanosoma conorhini]RNF24928.1 hypothetical protein Tco025E_02405 [Trypanosoma conorhini]